MKKDFRDFLHENTVVFDGAMGTMLQRRGLKMGEAPEVISITNRDILVSIHREYIESGANVVTTNTFGASELKLAMTGYDPEEIIDAAISAAKEAAQGTNTYVALDVGPLGELIEPMGELTFDRAYDIFARQIVQGQKSGADLIIIETMTDLYEIKAAVLAAKENSSLPVLATMSFEKDGRTFTGCLPSGMALTLAGLGVDALGINCSLGPADIYPVVTEILRWSKVPVMVQANAGLPKMQDGSPCYDVGADEFASYAKKFVESGVRIIGGCCGTTPEYISEVSKAVKGLPLVTLNTVLPPALCTPSETVVIDGVKVIGERINPTGKKLFKEALRNNDTDYILKQGISQVEAGAVILDVNVGLPEIDEKQMMVKVIKGLQSVTRVPLQIDSSDPEVIEAGLRYVNGKPIVNSVNAEDRVLDKILPLVKKYGAAVVGLTLDDRGIPDNARDRLKLARKIVKAAESYGIGRADVYIDTLTLTCSAQQQEVQETIKALAMVKEELGVGTILGVSNISFGMPRRDIINETFLSAAMAAGLNLPIINPNDEGMMDKVRAFNVLWNHDKSARDYISKYSDSVRGTEVKSNDKKQELRDIVIKGLANEAAAAVQELIKTKDELAIVNEDLIPALDVVGEQYEKGIIFLPQLIQCADTVKNAFAVLKESLRSRDSSGISKGRIILATVKGDIHDIGKNIVKVILENYNYEIIDLGKDVPIEKILKAAQSQEGTVVVGLSALMTTTIRSMEETIKALRSEVSDLKVMVGGAVLTEEYSRMIGADYYARDAREAVDIARKIFGEQR